MKHILWKIYAVVFCCIQALNLLIIEWSVRDLAFSAWYVVGSAALVGFAFKFKVAVLAVWKAYFGLLVPALAMFVVMLIYSAAHGASSEALLNASLLLLPQAPFWYAVWAYAYRSKQIWVQGV